MEMDAIVSLITNIGFPIACVIFLFRYLKQRETDHANESAKWMETVNNNTEVMRQMTDKMEHMLYMLEQSYQKQLDIKLAKAKRNARDDDDFSITLREDDKYDQ